MRALGRALRASELTQSTAATTAMAQMVKPQRRERPCAGPALLQADDGGAAGVMTLGASVGVAALRRASASSPRSSRICSEPTPTLYAVAIKADAFAQSPACIH